MCAHFTFFPSLSIEQKRKGGDAGVWPHSHLLSHFSFSNSESLEMQSCTFFFFGQYVHIYRQVILSF